MSSGGCGALKSSANIAEPRYIPSGRLAREFAGLALRVMSFFVNLAGEWAEWVRIYSTSLSQIRVQKGISGGADGVRTRDLIDAIDARSQLRYGPTVVQRDSLITPGPARRQTPTLRKLPNCRYQPQSRPVTASNRCRTPQYLRHTPAPAFSAMLETN